MSARLVELPEVQVRALVRRALDAVGNEPGHREIVEDRIRETIPQCICDDREGRHLKPKEARRRAQQFMAATTKVLDQLKVLPVHVKELAFREDSGCGLDYSRLVEGLSFLHRCAAVEGLAPPGEPRPDSFGKWLAAELALDTCRALGIEPTMAHDGKYRLLADVYLDVVAVVAPDAVRAEGMERHCRAALAEQRAREAVTQHEPDHVSLQDARPFRRSRRKGAAKPGTK